MRWLMDVADQSLCLNLMMDEYAYEVFLLHPVLHEQELLLLRNGRKRISQLITIRNNVPEIDLLVILKNMTNGLVQNFAKQTAYISSICLQPRMVLTIKSETMAVRGKTIVSL